MPTCPYDASTKIEDGVPCYFTSCQCHIQHKSWAGLFSHCKQYHGLKLSWLDGTYYGTMAKSEWNAAQQKQRAAASGKAAKHAPDGDPEVDAPAPKKARKAQTERCKAKKGMKADKVIKKELEDEEKPNDDMPVEAGGTTKKGGKGNKGIKVEDEKEAKDETPAAKPENGIKVEDEKEVKEETPAAKPEKPNDETLAQVKQPGDKGDQWQFQKQMMCWVNCNGEGEPMMPFTVTGPVEEKDMVEHKQVPVSGGRQIQLHRGYSTNMKPPPPHVDTSKQTLLELVPSRAGGQQQQQQQQAVALQSDSAASSSSGQHGPHPMVAVMKTIYEGVEHTTAWVKDQQNTGKWKGHLPFIAVKATYLECEGPRARGEGDCLRSTFPQDMKADEIELPDFYDFQVNHLAKGADNTKKVVQGVGRMLGALEITPGGGNPHAQLADLETLVALTASKEHIKLLGSPIFDPKYTWTGEAIPAMATYVEYHQYLLADRLTNCDDNVFPQYQQMLAKLTMDFEAGWKIRCQQYKDKMHIVKQERDRVTIKHIKMDVLTRCVHKGYCTLKHIADVFAPVGGSTVPLPTKVRGLANACLAGGIACDTFSGRKMEWEIMLWLYVCGVLANGQDFVICDKHKTCKVYGSIAKYLPPGLLEAFRLYARLHRPEGCQYFLVPAQFGTDRVSLPGALHTWCRLLLPEDHPEVKFNIMRKLFHKALRAGTTNEEQLKELMLILDAHSKEVQDKHYILRDPEDDVKLAKALVQTVLGADRPFPADDEVKKFFESCPKWKTHLDQLFKNIDGAAAGPESEGEESSDDDDLEHFEGSEMWGCKTQVREQPQTLSKLFDLQESFWKPLKPLLALSNGPSQEKAGEEDNDAEKEGEKAEKKENNGKKDNKDKKGKKEKKEKKEKKDKKDKEGDGEKKAEEEEKAGIGSDGEPEEICLEDGIQKHLYAKYEHIKSEGGRRMAPLTKEEKDMIFDEVKGWRQRLGKDDIEVPTETCWY